MSRRAIFACTTDIYGWHDFGLLWFLLSTHFISISGDRYAVELVDDGAITISADQATFGLDW